MTPIVLIYTTDGTCSHFIGRFKKGNMNFFLAVEPMPRTAPLWEPSSSFSSYLTPVIYVNATKSLTILPAFSTAHRPRRNSSPWNVAGSSLIVCEDHNSLDGCLTHPVPYGLFLETVSEELTQRISIDVLAPLQVVGLSYSWC